MTGDRQHNHGRRWYQFSLGTMLLLVTGIAVWSVGNFDTSTSGAKCDRRSKKSIFGGKR